MRSLSKRADWILIVFGTLFFGCILGTEFGIVFFFGAFVASLREDI
jgi:hypothetical protein